MMQQDEGGTGEGRRGGGGAGCLTAMLVVFGLAILPFGLIVYLSASSSASKSSGPAGGLAGLGSTVGLLLAATGAIALIATAVLYVRAARD